MKKNILTIIIMALTTINLVLTAVIIFVMLPTFQKTNRLITQVSSVIDLEIESTKVEGEDEPYTINDLETIPVLFTAKQTINLARSATDDKAHYVILEGFSLSMNKKSSDYKEVSALIKANQMYAKDLVKDVISTYTIDNIIEKTIREESTLKLQEFYKSDCIISVSLDGFLYN